MFCVCVCVCLWTKNLAMGQMEVNLLENTVLTLQVKLEILSCYLRSTAKILYKVSCNLWVSILYLISSLHQSIITHGKLLSSLRIAMQSFFLEIF